MKLFPLYNTDFHRITNHVLGFIVLFSFVTFLDVFWKSLIAGDYIAIVPEIGTLLIGFTTIIILRGRLFGFYLCLLVHLIDVIVHVFCSSSEPKLVNICIYLFIGLSLNFGVLLIKKDGIPAWKHLK